MKFKTYKGEVLYNVEITLKVDGVQAQRQEDGSITSRKGKPLYNISMSHSVAEIYTGSWEDSVSRVRTIRGTPIEEKYIFSLYPIDQRLSLGKRDKLTYEEVERLFKKAQEAGYEGLVLRADSGWYKVKQQETYDVVVKGVIEGTGKYIGKLGAVYTDKGKVGTGFTDKQRADLFNKSFIGTTIEVESMGLTPSGKFRHPRFLRERFDK